MDLHANLSDTISALHLGAGPGLRPSLVIKMRVRMFGTRLECRAERRKSAVLVEQVAKRFVGKFLERRLTVAGKQIDRGPGLIVELDALAWHVP